MSRNYPGHAQFAYSDDLEREMVWGDFIKAAIVALSRRHELKKGLKVR